MFIIVVKGSHELPVEIFLYSYSQTLADLSENRLQNKLK